MQKVDNINEYFKLLEAEIANTKGKTNQNVAMRSAIEGMEDDKAKAAERLAADSSHRSDIGTDFKVKRRFIID